jgi:sugar lactone lactonase YvrE
LETSEALKSGSFRCPTCKEEPTHSIGGEISELAASSFVKRVASGPPLDIQCEVCEEAALVQCVQCNTPLCSRCQEAHLQAGPHTADHTFVPLGELAQRTSSHTFGPFCSQHPDHEIDAFCRDCGLAVCPECIVPNHLYHNLTLLKEIGDNLKKSLKYPLNEVKQLEALVTQALEEVKLNLDVLSINDKRAEDTVVAEFGKIKAAIDQRQDQILNNLNTTFLQKQSSLTAQMKALECSLQPLQAAIRFAEGLLRDDNIAEILESKNQLIDRLRTLSQKKVELPPVCDEALAFASNSRQALDKAIQEFGQIDGNLSSDISPRNCHLEPAPKGGKFTTLVNRSFSIRVVIVKADGNGYENEEDKFETNLQGPSQDIQVKVEDQSNGTYTLSFTPSQIGDYQLHIKVSGKAIRDSPVLIQVLDKLGAHDLTTISNPVLQFGEEGSENGQFQAAQGICANSRGELLVADWGNNRIQIFTKDGEYLCQFGTCGSGNGQFNHPQGIAVDTQDRIYVTEWSGHRIQVFTPEGQYIRQFGSHGVLDGQFSAPAGIVIDPQNANILITEFTNNRVQVFDSQGRFLRRFGSGILASPVGICMNSRKEILVSEYKGHRVHVFDETGKILRVIGRGQFAFPRYLCVNGDDHLFICCSGNNKVFVYDQLGHLVHSFTNDRMVHPNGITCNPVDGSLAIGGENGHTIFIY